MAYLVAPLTITLALWLLAGVLLATGRRRLATWTAAMGLLLLWVCSTPAVGTLLAEPLERPYEACVPARTPTADAIVVLGGALAGAAPPRRPSFALGAASGRVWHAAELYRAGRAPLIIVAAGNRPEHAHEQVEAEAIRDMLVQLGVPPSAIGLEGRSTNTRENAALSRDLARSAGVHLVLMVTSARHMTRALETFRRGWAGLDVRFTPCPTEITVSATEPHWEVWLPTAPGLANVTSTLKEYAGILALAIM